MPQFGKLLIALTQIDHKLNYLLLRETLPVSGDQAAIFHAEGALRVANEAAESLVAADRCFPH